MQWIDFAPLAEFVDRSGIVRQIYGCSLIGRFEFIERQEQMKAILDAAPPKTTWEDLYDSDRAFRAAGDRCLVLNRIDLDWLTPRMVEQFLFARQDGDKWLPGWLVELNNPIRPVDRSFEEGAAVELGEVLAALSLRCNGLSEAIDLAANMPANLLRETIEARDEMLKTPEQKAEQTKKQQLANLKANYGDLMQRG